MKTGITEAKRRKTNPEAGRRHSHTEAVRSAARSDGSEEQNHGRNRTLKQGASGEDEDFYFQTSTSNQVQRTQESAPHLV
jgi:hypothetical protein